MRPFVKWLLIAWAIMVAISVAMELLLPVHDMTERVVRVLCFPGLGWLIGQWAGKRAAKEPKD